MLTEALLLCRKNTYALNPLYLSYIITRKNCCICFSCRFFKKCVTDFFPRQITDIFPFLKFLKWELLTSMGFHDRGHEIDK
jgi:hypothetical protein